jgi:hypothetical protein
MVGLITGPNGGAGVSSGERNNRSTREPRSIMKSGERSDATNQPQRLWVA